MLLSVHRITKSFPIAGQLSSRNRVVAVQDVSFTLDVGETQALVGESGSGKTTVGKMVVGLIPPDSGDIQVWGRSLCSARRRERRLLQREMSIVHQDPASSLNPRMTVGEIISEPLVAFRIGSRRMWQERVLQLVREVGLLEDHVYRYPHELSGGQKQRVAVARALASSAKLIVLDEPTSALDVSVQAQILNLLADLQKSKQVSYLFISHDLAVVRYISHRIAVLYRGFMVEMGRSEQIFQRAMHPYTRLLLSAVPDVFGPPPSSAVWHGPVPNAGTGPRPHKGCAFVDRCVQAARICHEVAPALVEVVPGHMCACHLTHGSAAG